jgi:RNA recognition motif-containing protein
MGKKLYVGNLPFSTNEQTLQQHFSQSGNVESCKIITDRDTGRSRGFAFVEYSSDEEAASAVSKLNGVEFEGRALTVNEARPQESRGGGFGGGGGGGRGGFGGGGRSGGGRGGYGNDRPRW